MAMESDRSADAWEEQGIASAENGEFVDALGFFERAIALKPSSQLHDYMAQCFMMIDGAEQKAVEAASAAVTLDQRSAVAQLTLARACLNAGDFGRAVAGFEAAIALDASMEEDASEDLKKARELLAEQIARERDRELVMHGRALRICQGDGTEGEGTGLVVWECSVVLAKYLERHVARREGVAGASTSTNDCDHDQSNHGLNHNSCHDHAHDHAYHDHNHNHYHDHHDENDGSFADIGLDGCNTLELGSGTGVAGLAAAALGARVLLTDIEDVLPLLRRNIEGNSSMLRGPLGCGHADAQAFDWAGGTCALDTILLSRHRKRRKMDTDREDGSSHTTNCDIRDAMPVLILAADVVFNKDPIEQLATILKHVLSSGAVLLLAHKSRHADVDAQMIGSLVQVGIELLEVPLKYHHPDFRSPRIKLFWGQLKDAPAHRVIGIPSHARPVQVGIAPLIPAPEVKAKVEWWMGPHPAWCTPCRA